MPSASAEVQALLTHVLSPLLASSDPSIDASTPSSIPLSELSPSDVKFLVTNIAAALSSYIQSAPPSLPSPSASNSSKPSLTTTALRSTPCEGGLLTPLSTVLALCSPLVSQILAVLLTLPNGPTLHFILKSLTLRSSLSPLASNNLSWALHHIQTLSDLLHSPTFTPSPLTYLELHSLHLLSSHHPLLLNKVTISMLLHTLPHPPKFGLKPLTLSLLNLKKINSTTPPPPLPSPSPSLLTIPTLPPLPLPPHLTPTPTFLLTLSTLQNILLTPKPTILTGSHGSGKTALLELLASHLGLQLITLNFDDTTDSKSLLGSYVCSEIPGEFIYQPGTLTQACLKGGILVLEDVDNIPLDVLSVIIPIVETRKLPTGEGVDDNFFCFGTRLGEGRVEGGRVKTRDVGNVISSYFCDIYVFPPTVEDLRLIAETQYKNVPSYIVSSFTNVFMEMMKNDNVSYIDWFKIIKRYSSYNWITSESEYVREGDKLKCLMDLEECLGYKCRGADGSDERFIECVVKEFEVTRNDIALKMNERIEVIEDDKIVKIGRGTIIKGNIIKEDQSNYVETYQTLKITQAISMATSLSEPVLLVGETGCGKTTVLQKLAGRCGRKLVVQNLSLSTDGGDLLGGYKPVEIKNYVTKIYNTFLHLFASTFSRTQNAQFLTFVKQAYKKHQWKKLSACFIKAGKMGGEKVEAGRGGKEWEGFRRDAKRFEKIRRSSETGLAFTFTEGILITCIKEGSWILLDEINLASPSTLQRLFSLLDGPSGTITIQERGDLVPVKRHDNFRIFAAMNPATDNGKKDLPKSMRSRFTEIYVDELKDEAELRKVSERYFSGLITKNGGGGSYVDSTVKIYLQCKVKAEEVLVDSQGKKPSYTLRTLCRGLSASVRLLGFNKMSLKRSVFEGFMLAFAGGLEEESKKIVENLVKSCISVEITKKELSQIPQKPNGISPFICVSPFWLKKGELESIDWTEEVEGVSKFVLTKSAEGNLRALSRSIAAGPWPILIEGPTSAGKTTLVEYLSAKTGHRCVRINNHEHTDVQEYTGSYVTNSTGQLVFREGILVEALRKGWWIILDELNLAPSEVLEALNRLLDDNRELYISETQETVRPHEHFRLFATQNPSGAYGGRKPLSKAFRNRFVEVSMGDIPNDELSLIMERRCGCPPSHSKLLVKVLNNLQLKRSKSSVFRGKSGLITPRDLLRWAERGANSKGELAFEGYCILAERLRTEEEKEVVKSTVEEVIKVEIDSLAYIQPNSSGRLQLQQILTSSNNSGLKATGLTTKEIAPTSTLLRLLLLVGKCIQKKEPVLLVGETGCGKTTVIQLYGLLFKRYLHVVNCHANTETGDLLGGLRPLRGRGGKVEEMVATIKDLVELCGTQHNNWLQASNLVVPEMEIGGEKDINEIEHKAISFARDLFKYLKTLYERDSSDSSDGKNKDEDKDKDELTDKPPEPPIKRKRMDSDASTTTNPQPIDKATQKIINETMSEIEAAFRRSNALFAWLDGPLVHAMREGHLILLDEMSLAEDAVLERLNSVLEPSRTLTLAEKGGAAGEEGIDEITGHSDFRIFATMNPGGDFGKRELSPALRSRFTEIWVPQIKARVDFELVLDLVLGPELASTLLTPMLDYVDWFNQTICGSANSQFVDFDLSLRDVLGWARFIGACVADKNDLSKTYQCFLHGAGLMHLDGLGLGTGVSSEGSWAVRSQSKAYLINKVPAEYLKIASIGFSDDLNPNETSYVSTKTEFGVLPFTISTGPVPIPEKLEFSMTAPTTCMNLRRVTRALQLSKPILLEGSPGVGKTSLIQALATASGNNLVRINLSEQTDISDLMGSDLPIAGEEGAKFKWFDGVFLKALKRGDWVLLDELNLASQSVLEGLNSCLDHRSEVFIPELCATYQCPPTFRVFAAQNPLSQGGGRKGLPKSFLNRFTKVFVEALTGDDLINIVNHRYPKIDSRTVTKMVNFNTKVQHDVVDVCKFGRVGFPWEFNLRDVFRWCSLAVSENAEDSVGDFVDAIYLQRMRTKKDREEMMLLYEEVFGEKLKLPEGKCFNTIGDFVQVGSASFKRVENPYTAGSNNFELPTGLLRPLETVVRCVNLNWPCLIIGPKASGKTAIVNALAGAVGVEVVEWAMTPGTDVTELLGCFEQIDSEAGGREMMAGVKKLIENLCFDKIRIRGQEENLKVLNGLWWAIDKKVEMNEGVLDEIIIKMTLEALEKAVVVEGGVGEKASALIEVAKKIKTDMAKATKAGSTFQWVDGVLVKAMQEGRWLSLNNVNFCPSSVLDRLNPLMEMGGELVLTEGGGDDGEGEEGVRVIKPHPNFRLFLSMNSERGEVSRAMRNRCIEVALIGGFGDGEEGQNEGDVMDCLYRAGIRDALTAERMIDIHENEVKLESELSSRKLVLMAEMFRDLIKSGLGVERALEESWRCVYSVESGVEMDLDGGVENGEGMFELGEGKWFEDWRLARAQRDARLAIYLKREWKGGVGLPRSLVKLMGGKGGGVTKWLKVGVGGEEQEWLKELCCDVAMCEFVRAGGAETLDFEVRKNVLVGGGYELGDVARIYSIVEELGLVEGCPFEFGGRPLDLGSSEVYGFLLKGVDKERVENYNGLQDRVKIEVLERLEAVLSLRRVKDLAEGSSRSKTSSMSPIELSYSIAAKGVNANAARGNKLIVLLVEIFTAIDRMEGENFGELIKIRDEMWFYLNSFWAKVWIDGDGFDGRFLVYWRWLVKAYIGCGGGVAGVDRMMAKVDEVLGRSGVFSSNLLWKKGGHPAGCMTKEGLEGKTKLLEVGARAVVGKWASLAKLVEEGHGLLYMDEEIKREVLMAQCTLQWELTDEKGEKVEEEEKKEGGNSVQIAGAIFAKADKAKVDFTSTLRRKTVDVNIKTVENQAEAYAIVRGGGDEISLGEDPALALMSKFGAIQASVLVDRWSVWEEQKLIDSLCQLTDMNGLKRLIVRISRWIDLTLNGGRKVEVCRGWQTLVWASESVEFSTILRLRSVLLPTMLALNGEDVWNASFNDLGRIEVSISNPILWGGAKEERENSEVERFENFGYARFAHPVVTAQVARLFSEVGDALDGSAVGNQRITLQNAKARGAQAGSIISRGLRAIEGGEGWGLVERGVENILTVFAEADAGRVWPDGGAVLEGMRRGEVGNLGGCKDEKFVSLVADVLEPLVKFVVEKQNLNQALVLLGLATLHLYAPTEPLDPGKKPEAKGMNLELRMQVLAARGETKRWNARLSVGGGEEELVGFEKEMKRAEKQRRKVVARPEGSYDRLFKELVQFVKSVGNVDSVLKLAKGEGGSEINWLRSAAEFSSRMLNFYGGYDDVMHPILSGVQMVMKGLRLKTLEVGDNKISSVEKAVGFLLEVPFNEATTELVDDSTFKELGREIGQFAKRKGGGGAVGVLEAQVGVLFAIIQRTEIDLKVGACNIKSAHNILRRCFREIVNIWKIADEKRFEEEEELKGETEEQREERELREQFPDFSREFTKIVERVERKDELESDDEEEEEVEEEITSSFRLTPEQIETLCGVHSRVFGEGGKGVDDGLRRRVFGACFNSAARIIPCVANKISGLDEQVVLGNLLSLSQTSSLCAGVELGRKGGNFNTGSNVGAVLKAEKILSKIVMRITVLLKAYPGHSVLLTIGQIAEKLRGCDVQSPLARVLCGVEVLLAKSQDWEQHASARVKLGEPLEQLSKLVADWRKLELESWASLLDERERNFANKARRIWARLYSVLESGGGSASVAGAGVPTWLWKGARSITLGIKDVLSTKELESLQEISKLCDSFILTAGVGEIETRLSLLASFGGEMKIRGGAKCDALGRILTSLVDYYNSFLHSIVAHKSVRKSECETQLKNEVKLAKWDDQNYYAMAETTQKNHRTLNKLLKNYDEVLNQPVAVLIEELGNKGVREREGGVGGQERGATKLPSDTEMFGAGFAKGEVPSEASLIIFSELPAGPLGKITRIAAKHLATLDNFSATTAAGKSSGLTEAIFERIAALRLPAATKVMKERGLVDLLKTLQNEGFGTGLWSTPGQIRDLYELLSLTHPVGLSERYGKYFWKLVSETKKLRGEITQFGSRFIGGRECKLMLGMAEQILISVLQNRSLFASGRVFLVDMKDYADLVCGGNMIKLNLIKLVAKNRRVGEQLRQLKLVLNGLSNTNDAISRLDVVIACCDKIESDLGDFSGSKIFAVTSKIKTEVESGEVYYSNFESHFEGVVGKNEFLDVGLKRVFETAREQIAGGEVETTSSDVVDEVVKGLQIIVQQILGHFSSLKTKPEGKEEEELALVKNHVKASELHQICSAEKLDGFLISLVGALDSAEMSEEMEKAKAGVGLLKVVGDWVVDNVEQKSIDFGAEIGKMGYVVVRVFRQLVAKGFCHEDEGDGEGDGEGGGEGEGKFTFEDDVEGTGMGEGEGKEDVTDQIENEEQLLGLKGDEDKEEKEKKQNEQLDEKEVDTGMEMENDFDGDTFDMPDKKEDDQPQKDDGEEEELDREMGEGGGDDPNEEVVDEKLWDEEDKEENEGKEKEGEDKFEKDSKVEGGMAEDEMRTKEDEEDEDGGKGKEEEGKEKEKVDDKDKGEGEEDKKEEGEDGPEGDDKDGDGGEDKGGDEEEGEINDDLEDNYEDNHNLEVKGLEEEEKEDGMKEDEGDEMNLEDMQDLDGEGDGEGEDEDLETEEVDKEEEGMEDRGEEKMTADDEPENEEEDEALKSANVPTATDVEMNDQGEEEQQEEDGEDEEEPVKLDVNADDDDNDAEHGVSAQMGNSKANQDEEDNEVGEEEEGGAGGEEDEEEDKEPGKEGGDPEEDGGEGEWTKGRGEEGGKEEQEKERKQDDFANPFRDPGDVMKKWHDRLDMLDDQERGGGEEENVDVNDDEMKDDENPSGKFEFAEKGGGGTTQVLGAIFDDTEMLERENDGEEDGAEIGNEEEKEKLEEKKNEGEKDEKKEAKEKGKKKEKEKKEKREEIGSENNKTDDDKDGVATDMDIEEKEEEERKVGDDTKLEDGDEEEGEGEGERQTKAVTDLTKFQADGEGEEEDRMDVEVRGFERTARDPASVSKWAEIYATTLPLARRLCEKLRLVMEPLLATKLQGDYKSGKRINMKKVISYIASGYRRDKIWLRRTKPAKRNYRVLLAIDDSESMQKGGAGDQALQALAILANGMSQLEIGKLGVASFGEGMKMVHGFDQPFVADSGSKCVSEFKFDQQRTRMADCVQGAVDVLLEDGDSEGRKLCFLISDGRVERDNRDRLKRLVREMGEKGILLVMIVIDGVGKNSILSMREVEFVGGKTKMKYFMENYPFPFYLLCNDVASLPDVLGDSLRQWLEMLARLEGAN